MILLMTNCKGSSLINSYMKEFRGHNLARFEYILDSFFNCCGISCSKFVVVNFIKSMLYFDPILHHHWITSQNLLIISESLHNYKPLMFLTRVFQLTMKRFRTTYVLHNRLLISWPTIHQKSSNVLNNVHGLSPEEGCNDT